MLDRQLKIASKEAESQMARAVVKHLEAIGWLAVAMEDAKRLSREIEAELQRS